MPKGLRRQRGDPALTPTELAEDQKRAVAIRDATLPPLPVHLSPGCASLLRGMIAVEPKRMMLTDVLNHP